MKGPNWRHGHTWEGGVSPTYMSWTAMKNRCLNPKHPAFHNYGGRGITICRRWMRFEGFLLDMGERPAGRTLDRIDGNRGYNKRNCRWATMQEQIWNSRNCRFLTVQGLTLPLYPMARRFGMNPSTLRERLVRGWNVEEAVLTPIGGRRDLSFMQ